MSLIELLRGDRRVRNCGKLVYGLARPEPIGTGIRSFIHRSKYP